MKKRIFLLIILACLLLAITAKASDALFLQGYVIQSGVTSGGGYALTSLTWQVSGGLSGGGYLMPDPSATELTGNGCCCSYLPCVTKK
jgi:hypothetical protein